MRLVVFLLPLVACGGGPDINGTYTALHTRSGTCGGPAPSSTQVQIIDTPSEHSAHVLGTAACDIDFTVTDYGGVGFVNGVEPNCAFQPQGLAFSSGEFSPHQISVTWTSGGTSPSCTVTDTWNLSR